MEEKKRSVASHAMIYAFIVAVAGIVFHLVLFITDLYLDKTIGYFGILITLAGMVWGTLEYRKNYLNGYMTYGKAFQLCFFIGLFAGILSALYMIIFATAIHPAYPQELLEQAREQMISSQPDMSEEQIDQAMAMSEKFMSPVMMAVWAFFGNALFSAILALLAGLFLKKEDKSMPGLNTSV